MDWEDRNQNNDQTILGSHQALGVGINHPLEERITKLDSGRSSGMFMKLRLVDQ
ncbi:hypothetical protein D3OALGA1CA_1630 [Olavius algarvensis associated proteobacterium Delta 3]|nr:hypothetical protein D3OALGB2SA_1600 [Olavius algarvensis associated proteobacterium Delta 3]CAB5104340.1 hypothetical protein D3OALGA1CA_1630 [Olavius algarvensis associated proteobacterium Delta 3]